MGSQFGVDLEPQAAQRPECVDWFFKADAALRIRYGYVRHWAQVRAIDSCFPWFLVGKPPNKGGCANGTHPEENSPKPIHRRRHSSKRDDMFLHTPAKKRV